MRISSLQIFNIARDSMAKANEATVKTQEQMSAGKRVLTPSDDPVASIKIPQLTDELASVDQYLKNIDIAENNLNLEESIMNNVVGVVQKMQEIAVAAGNTAVLTENEYKAFAAEVSTRLDELVNLINTQNANGDFIFGGYKSAAKPFSGDAFSGFKYQGDEGQQFIKVASNTQVAATDSGKSIFLDTKSATNTVQTSANPANTAKPPASISIGQVVNQTDYDKFYPEDIVISFNADSNLSPPGKNFTAVERSTGRVITANQAYVPGEEIQLKGVSFKFTGSPASGSPAIAATRLFGADALPTFPVDFTVPNTESFTITVGGRTERLVLDTNITNAADLTAALNSSTNGNANRLANLGITADALGFHMPQGMNMTIANGTANINTVLGLNSVAGSISTDGQAAKAGDRFFIESSEKQSILTTLARFKDVLGAYDGTQESKDAMSTVVASTIKNLSHGLTSVVDAQTKIGARLNTLESTRNLHLDTQLISKKVMTDLQSLDYAEAATRLSQQSMILQAAQQSFIRVSKLSLFDRL